MIIRRSIDKEEVKDMPKAFFPGQIHVIQTGQNISMMHRLFCIIRERQKEKTCGRDCWGKKMYTRDKETSN